jgi:transcriptional regulator of acetoin/glycerol metabolism
VGEVGSGHLPAGLSPPIFYARRGDRAANRLVVERALLRAGGSVTRAARLLGVGRNTLRAALAPSVGPVGEGSERRRSRG